MCLQERKYIWTFILTTWLKIILTIYGMNYTKGSPNLRFIGLEAIYGTVLLSKPLRISKWDQKEILLYRDAQHISNFRFQFKVNSQRPRKTSFFFFFSSSQTLDCVVSSAFLWASVFSLILCFSIKHRACRY